jgi:hypothetical protein
MANTLPPSGKKFGRLDKLDIGHPAPMAGVNRTNSKSQLQTPTKQRSRRQAKLSRTVLKAVRDWLAPWDSA